jgi:hypothetical protein
MDVAAWLMVALLTATVVLLVFILNRGALENVVSIRGKSSDEMANVIDSRLVTRSMSTPIAASKSDEGKLIAAGAGLLELEIGFDGPIMFFRNDNKEKENFYIDFLAYSWFPHEEENPLTVLSIVYDSTEPDDYVFEPSPISMNQNFPNAAKENGAFVLAWKGGNRIGMQGSSGGRGVMVLTLQPRFNMIPFDGKLIINHGGTQRFDVRTAAAGALRFAVVGWFGKSI